MSRLLLVPGSWIAIRTCGWASWNLTSGRFFSSIEMHEGEDMFNCVTGFAGDDVLMYASDYPHSECHFPNSVDYILGWSSLKLETRQKLLWDNAARFDKQT